jgi:hypothetical protein
MEQTRGATQQFELTPRQFRAFLEQLATNAGSIAELGRRLDVSGQFIGDVIAGKKQPGKKLLGALGGNSRVSVVYVLPMEISE